jgi:hypothetical protein
VDIREFSWLESCCQELRLLPFLYYSYKTPKPNTKSINTLFNSNYNSPPHSQFRPLNSSKSKTKTNFWVQCSNTPLYSIFMFGLRLARQNVRKNKSDLKFWEMTFPRAHTRNYARGTPKLIYFPIPFPHISSINISHPLSQILKLAGHLSRE